MNEEEIKTLTERKHAIIREADAHDIDKERARVLLEEFEGIEARLAVLTEQEHRARQAAGVTDSPLLLPSFMRTKGRGRKAKGWVKVNDELYKHATIPRRYKVFLDGEWLTAH